MGFASGAVSFRRFYITGQYAGTLENSIVDDIAAHAFGKHGGIASDGVEFGWIVPTHLFDIDFEDPSVVTVGRFIYVAMRMDRTAPPAGIVASYRKMEEAAALHASDREFLTKTERRLAKESALQRAEEEARSGAFRRIAAYPLLIDMQDGIVYFGSLGVAAADKLMSLFADTFGTALTPALTEETAFRIATRQKTAQALDQAAPVTLIDPPTRHAEEDDEPGGADDRFLGREFLTWLWYRLDTAEGMFKDGTDTILVNLIKQMRLDCPFDLTGSDMIRHEVPTSAPEARAALRVGKLPIRAGMLLETAGEDWAFSLAADTMNVSGLSIAKIEEKDPSAILEHRFDTIRALGKALDALFAQFLTVRLGRDWSSEVASIRRWATAAPAATSTDAIRIASA